MREFASSSLSLAGSLLIAHPQMMDPNFRRAVLFISANDAQEGSFGLTLNRPAGRTVAEILPDKDLGLLGSVPVFLGGPVGADQLIFASFRWDEGTESMTCQHHLMIEEAAALVPDGAVVLRAFVGYAGWSKGQLEGEMAQRTWLVRPVSPDLLELDRCPTLWREITSSFGPWFQLLAEAPDELRRN